MLLGKEKVWIINRKSDMRECVLLLYLSFPVLLLLLLFHHQSKMLVRTLNITSVYHCRPYSVLSGPGREGCSGQSQGFSGEQHILCGGPIHHCAVCLRPGSAAQPICTFGSAPPQPHGHHTRYCHTHCTIRPASESLEVHAFGDC